MRCFSSWWSGRWNKSEESAHLKDLPARSPHLFMIKTTCEGSSNQPDSPWQSKNAGEDIHKIVVKPHIWVIKVKDNNKNKAFRGWSFGIGRRDTLANSFLKKTVKICSLAHIRTDAQTKERERESVSWSQ